MLWPSSPAIRRWVKYWLAWTGAGIFYTTQDFMTRLSRNETTPWRSVVMGEMAAMYICAAFTPAILWLGRRWALEQAFRWRHTMLHFGASVVFSLVSTALEVPVLAAIGLLPALKEPASLARDFWILLPYDLHGAIV